MLSIPRGASGVVACVVVGNETSPNVTWYLSPDYPLPRAARQEGRLLYIDSVNSNLARQYTCKATNDIGSAQSTTQVDIQRTFAPLLHMLTVHVLSNEHGTSVSVLVYTVRCFAQILLIGLCLHIFVFFIFFYFDLVRITSMDL